jgi:hypothetical protein
VPAYVVPTLPGSDYIVDVRSLSLNNAADVVRVFGDGGLPSIVYFTGGSLALPDQVNLKNVTIVVENGDLNFNGDRHLLENVTIVVKDGSVNLGDVRAVNSSVYSAGAIHMNQGARFSGKNFLGTKNGDVIFNGATETIDPKDFVKVVAHGDIFLNAGADVRGEFWSSEDFFANRASTIVGKIRATQSVTFNASVQIISDGAEYQPLIGIIDTGFNGSNPDIDYSRIILGRDRIDRDDNPLIASGQGNEHGTHILGLIGATQGNDLGIDGINDQAPIWLGRAVGTGQWSDSLIEFVDAARNSGQPNAVVNLSLDLTQRNLDQSITTRYELTPKERQALEYARQNNVIVVVASGNTGGIMSALGQASQEFENIITVGAVDPFNRRSEYSSFGKGLDLVAYGGTENDPVLSTVGSAEDLNLIIRNLGLIVDEVENFADRVSIEIDKELADLPEDLTSDQTVILNNASERIDEFLAEDQTEIDRFFTELDDLITIVPEDLQDVLSDLDLVDLLASSGLEDGTLDLGIGEMAGTSVATAQVTGGISQIWAVNPKLNFAQIKRIIKETAIDLGQAGWDLETGSGLFNLPLALEIARKTSAEDLTFQPFAIPTTWSGDGQVIPLERAANFNGTVENKIAVGINGGLNIRSSHGERFTLLGKLATGDRIEFDQAFQDDVLVVDPNGEGSSNLWYKLADGRGWVSAIYVGQIQEILPPVQPTPPVSLTSFPVQGAIRETWIKNPQLGNPTGAEFSIGNGVTQQAFENGYISYDGNKTPIYQTKKPSVVDDVLLGKKAIDFIKKSKPDNPLYKAASFIRRLVSPRGSSKIVFQTTLKIARFGGLFRNKFVNAIPLVRQILFNTWKSSRPLATSTVKIAKKFLTNNTLGNAITGISKFATNPKIVAKVARFTPYLNLALSALDIGIDLATAKTEKEKQRADLKAKATIVGGVVGGIIGALGFGGGALVGAGAGAALTSAVVDATYWVDDNKERVVKKFNDTVSGIGNKLKSIFRF